MATRKLIPIYDATAPVACTIDASEIPARLELLERLRASMRSVERTPTGLLLRFPDEPWLHDELATFAADEKRCCQFWGFAVADCDDELTLRWDGPPTVGNLLDQLQGWFVGDEPTSGLEGLL